ncbi:MAG TPA: hypothetical protein VJC11_00295, partial [Patescibacteria group bacterium]|nr:hypothetical protein [Patescibacteria group bacterium]
AMRMSALQFLLRAQDKNGLWRYWTSQNPRGRQSVKIDPDVDDLAVISSVLDLYGIKNDNARFFIDQNQNTDGLFWTWITQDEKNDVDCVVNANVLLYLKQNDERVCSYINKSLQESSSCSPYYPNAFALPYAATRAQKNGITCFQESQQIVVSQILKEQRPDGSFGDSFSTALALNTLLNVQYGGPELFRAAKHLITAQRPNGSWDRSPFFTGYGLYFGSEELTTALALEGLRQIVNR